MYRSTGITLDAAGAVTLLKVTAELLGYDIERYYCVLDLYHRRFTFRMAKVMILLLS